MKLPISIISPEKTLFKGEADEITLPTNSGEITILSNHAPLVSRINHGEIIIKNDDTEKVSVIFGGFVQVLPDHSVLILADSAYHLDEINEKEAEEAKKRAEGLISSKAVMDDKERFAEIQAELLQSITALKVLRKYRKK